jgi:valyl-tRNA synthetase
LLENLQILQKVWNIQRILLKHELGINDAKNWKPTVEEEMNALKKSNTWVLSKLPKIAKRSAASGYFEPKGMLKVELYTTKHTCG